jgi:hypothetical protein
MMRGISPFKKWCEIKAGIRREYQKQIRAKRIFSYWRFPFKSENNPRETPVIKKSIGGIRKIFNFSVISGILPTELTCLI